MWHRRLAGAAQPRRLCHIKPDFFLVPKLPLGNPLLCKALLCMTYKKNFLPYCTSCPSRAWAKICVPKQELGNEVG